MSAARQKACPVCGKPGSPEQAPFCSPRCADIDLYRWLKGAYVVPGAPAEEIADDDQVPPPRRPGEAARKR